MVRLDRLCAGSAFRMLKWVPGGGKSGLHRAGRWVTPSGGDPGKVPQKADRPALTLFTDLSLLADLW